jgi:hypothetical protein
MSPDDEAARHPERPRFAPPMEPPHVIPGPPPGPMRPAPPPAEQRGSVLGVMAAVASIVLVLSPFLPWMTVRATAGLFGESLVRETSFSGFRADGTGTVLAISGLAALALAGSGVVLGRPKLQAGTAIAGAVALICALVFLIRLQELGNGFQTDGSGLLGDVGISPSYGWYVALAAALVVLGASLADLSRKTPADAAAWDPAASPWRP